MTERHLPLVPAQVTSIMVPLDGSTLAEEALSVAVPLARALHARLTLLHVLEHDPPATVHGEPHLTNPITAFSYLVPLADRFRAMELPIDTHVHDNPERDVALSIVAHADELSADLIVMANHGSSGLRGLLFGRVAQQVLARGTRPVLIIPVGTRVSVPFQRIGVPLDGSSEAEGALPLALALGLACDARLSLIRATPTVSTVPGDLAASAVLSPRATSAVLDLEAEQAERDLDAVVARIEAVGGRADRRLLRGDPAEQVAAEARRIGADLLVMASHGRAGLGGIWAGSVAPKLASRFAGPVLLIRALR